MRGGLYGIDYFLHSRLGGGMRFFVNGESNVFDVVEFSEPRVETLDFTTKFGQEPLAQVWRLCNAARGAFEPGFEFAIRCSKD